MSTAAVQPVHYYHAAEIPDCDCDCGCDCNSCDMIDLWDLGGRGGGGGGGRGGTPYLRLHKAHTKVKRYGVRR